MPNNTEKPANSVSETAVPASAAPNWREAQLAPPQVAGRAVPAPQVPHEVKGRIAISVKAVLLYASHSQVLRQHQLPHGKFQVSNDTFSCIPVRFAKCANRYSFASIRRPCASCSGREFIRISAVKARSCSRLKVTGSS